MMQFSPEDIEITLCCAVNLDHFYFCASLKEYAQQGVCHTIILQFKEGSWKYWVVETNIVGISAFQSNKETIVIAAGFEGSIHKATPGGFEWESIGKGPEMPSTLRRITNLNSVGDYIYVTGMARQVFRRQKSKSGIWERYDQGALIPKSQFEVNGFLAIDGFRSELLYAVGFHGHIWHCPNGLWKQLDSPTNLKLTCLKCSDERVVVGGNNGILLEGEENRWKIIEQNLTTNCFRFMASFNNQLYLTTEDGGLYTYKDGTLIEIKELFEGKDKCYTLSASHDALVVAGSRAIKCYDGNAWTPIELPF
jgi:hypothetical protein